MTQSNEPTIEQKNEAIARFMGIIPIPPGGKRLGDIKPPEESIAFLNYNENWELLMPVVEKIESLYDGNAFTIEVKGDWCLITQNTQHWMAFRDTIDLKGIQVRATSKITAVYQAVYQFITWYNQQKQTNEQ